MAPSAPTVKPEHDTFGLINDVSPEDWERIRQKALSSSWYANPDDPLEKANETTYWNSVNMIPNFDCPYVEQVGTNQKGESKYVCNPERVYYDGKPGGCLIYSIGSAGDFRFEDAMYEMHGGKCEIHVFDPAKAFEREGDVENKNIHYHAWGFLSSYDDSASVVWPKGRGGEFITFHESLRVLGHSNRTIDIFKIDCEGCEWSTHKDWIHHDIRQILIETHGVPLPDGTPEARWYQKPMNLIEYFQDYKNNGFALFNKDPNGENSLELCFVKLQPDFWKRPFMALPDPLPLDTVIRMKKRKWFKHDGSRTGWEMVDWSKPITKEEEKIFKCEYVPFVSTASKRGTAMCVHTVADSVSDSIRKEEHFHHCDILPEIWNSLPHTTNENAVYVEIGANIGSCVLEMLLGTKANIIAFEPHPMNIFAIKRSVSLMDKKYKDRLRLFPVGLGDAAEMNKIFGAEGNMGNSIIGKKISDPGRKQKFNEFEINVERMDSIIDLSRATVKLLKLDAQGYECKVLNGWGTSIPKKIERIKFELAPKWLREQDCRGLLSVMKTLGYDLYRDFQNGQFSSIVGVDTFKFMEVFGVRGNNRFALPM